MANQQTILSLDIGGSRCKVGLVDHEGQLLKFEQYKTQEIRDSGVEDLIDRLQSFTADTAYSGVAIGIPATVDWEHNHVRGDCEEIPWLSQATTKRYIRDELNHPVLLVNDVEAFLVGEWKWGELKGLQTGVVISLGESMGSALLWNEEPQQGRRGSIMELENISLDTHAESEPGYPPGSSHQWLSGWGLRHQMDSVDAESTSLANLFREERSPYCDIVNEFEFKLAHLLGTIVMMLDPERIVLGGGLTRSHEKWLSNVKEKMNDFVMEQYQGLPSITLAQLRDKNITKGPAAFWDWKQDNGK